MKFPTTLFFTLFPLISFAKPLVSFSAAANSSLSVLGTRNLEAARDVRPSENTADLSITLGNDPFGTPALHYHRIAGDIRAEYHVLNGKTEANKTYYIGYSFMLGEIEKSLMIWQFKEFLANNAHLGGANIPLALEVTGAGTLEFQYQANSTAHRVAQWTSPVLSKNTKYTVGIVINTGKPTGWVEFWWDGKQVDFTTTGTKRLEDIVTFPGRSDPKFGAYRGEAVGIDTWVYDIVVGEEWDDVEAVVVGDSCE